MAGITWGLGNLYGVESKVSPNRWQRHDTEAHPNGSTSNRVFHVEQLTSFRLVRFLRR